MSFLERHIASAAAIIDAYTYAQPFASFLQAHFARNKKFGSKDRKQIREACYGYFRCAKLFPALETAQIMSKYFAFKYPQLLVQNSDPLTEESIETKLLNLGEEIVRTFPFHEALSAHIDRRAFVLAHLEAGKVFFRKTQPQRSIILPDLVEQIAENTFAVSPHFSLNELHDKGLIQIQDLASQWACEQIQPGPNAWELCCGAGGKTMHLSQAHPQTRFFASDIRQAAIHTLQERMETAGITTPFLAKIDLSHPLSTPSFHKKGKKPFSPPPAFFSDIIADVPCTGSGVWRRNPEHLLGFKENKIEDYANRQRMIVQHALPFLKNKGVLHYITCSAYAAENEGQDSYFEEMGLQKETARYLNALSEGGDLLYYARWTKRE
jgi:16S rRNA (cytosine967-C5)-methyltransferase